MEVSILYKRVWSDQETRSRNRGGGASSNEAAQEYLAPSGVCSYLQGVILRS